MAQANVKLTVDASGATRALKGVQSQTTKLQSAFGGLKTAIAGIGIGVLVKGTIQAATNFEKLNQRLKILTKDNGTYGESLKLAEQAQTKFGLSSIDALEGVTNLQARLGPLGSSMEEISAIFNGFNTAAILSGASAQEQAGAMRQLTQALGSGVLRGDEFNSISEQMSAVLKPIADQLGVNVGALRDMAAEGKITKDVVVAAFKKIEKQGAGALKQLIKNDPTMTFKVLGNEAEKLSITVGTILAPAILDATVALTKIVEAANTFTKSPIGQTAAIFTGIAFAIKGVSVAVGLLKTALTLAATQLSFVGAQALVTSGGFKGMAATSLLASGGIGKLTLALGALKLAALATGFGAVALAIGAITTAVVKHIDKQKEYNRLVKEGGEEEITAAIKAIEAQKSKLNARLGASNRVDKSLKRQIKSLDDQLIPLQELLDKTKAIAAKNKDIADKKEEQKKIQEEINALEEANRKKQEEYQQAEMNAVKAKGKLIDQLSDQRALAKASINGNLKQVQTQQEINALVAIHGEGLRDIITNYIEGTNKLKKQKDEADQLKNKFDEIGEAIESNIKDNLRDAITGAQSFGQAMTNVLNRIRDKIIDAQLDRLVGGFSDAFSAGARGEQRKGIGGFLGGLFGGKKERGGPVSAGGAYLVGERGPEILQMGPKGGNIIPNSAIGKGGSLANLIEERVDDIKKFYDELMNVNDMQGLTPSVTPLQRANGGSVKAGQPYIVGERQPELFVPSTSGTILPSVSTGEGGTTNNMITVNVDAANTTAQGDNGQAEMLGKMLAGAVQDELLKQQRPGGILYR